jgi:hypothetical protein
VIFLQRRRLFIVALPRLLCALSVFTSVGGLPMRRRLQKFLPIFMIALTVQILAPIGVSWAAAFALVDPLGPPVFCHDTPGNPIQGDPGGDRHAGHGICWICCTTQVGTSFDAPRTTAITALHRPASVVTWRDAGPKISITRSGSNSQPRAPPQAI